MKLVKAENSDSEKLLSYFSQSTLSGPVHLRLRRMFNFFNQYRFQSEDFVTYLLENDSGEIEAMASMIFRKAYIDGQPETIGYAVDLRVSPTRSAITNWSHHFLPVLNEERLSRNCKYIFSVVAHSQRQAYNALIRPRHFRRKMPRYHLYRRFQAVSLHGVWPFHDLPLAGIKIRSARGSDLSQLAEYILKKSAQRPLRYYGTPEEFCSSLEQWQDLFVENFLLALDRNERIIGCTAPWNPERVQRVYPKAYDAKAQNFQDILRILSWFGVAHPLPKEEGEFQVRHLTHLFADNSDIFYSLLYNAFRQSGKNEALIYPHFEGELLTMPPRSFISATMKFGLYCVLAPTDPIPDFLRPKTLQTPPVFETAFL